MPFLLYIKVSDSITYYQRNRAKEYYQNNKERLREEARNKFRELSNEEKETKKEYGRKDTIIVRRKQTNT